MAYCIKCYDQLPSEAVFCINCGARQPAQGPVEGPTERLSTEGHSSSRFLSGGIGVSTASHIVTAISHVTPDTTASVTLGVSGCVWCDAVYWQEDPITGEWEPKEMKIGVRIPQLATEIEGDLNANNTRTNITTNSEGRTTEDLGRLDEA